MKRKNMYLVVAITCFIVFVWLIFALFAEAGNGVIKVYDKDGKVTNEVNFNDNNYRPYIRPAPKKVKSNPPQTPTIIYNVPQKETAIKEENQEVTITKSVVKKGRRTGDYVIITRDNRYNNMTPRQKYFLNRRIKSGDLPGPERWIWRIK